MPTLVPPTPVSLLARLKTGSDPTAWPRFVQLYTPLLFARARRLGFAGADAADLVQDLFADLLVQLPRFRHDPSRRFRGWLLTLLTNKARDRWRRAGVSAGPLDDVAGPDEVAEWAEAEYRRALVARLARLMQAEFEERTWQACWLYVAEGMPAEEVATRVGMSVASVYQARSRVLRRLRQELDGLMD